MGVGEFPRHARPGRREGGDERKRMARAARRLSVPAVNATSASTSEQRPVLLIGNYALDRQQSMLRFGAMMLEGLTAAGVSAELMQPPALFGGFEGAGMFAAKWLAY